MTQEYKELLLKDLSVRLPYGVKCQIAFDEIDIHIEILENVRPTMLFNQVTTSGSVVSIENVKPYLRPMSSMTEEEKEEFEELFPSYSISIERMCVYHSKRGDFNLEVIDWLNKKMFAYRTIDGKDMFELGLALEAPEGMYK